LAAAVVLHTGPYTFDLGGSSPPPLHLV